MIKKFHESPKALFDLSKHYNDYIYILQYCLNDKEYYDYVVSEIKAGKEVIFDNSAFEYGLDLPSDDIFAENIKKLSSFAPDKKKFYFIVNDYLDCKDKTIKSMQDWVSKYGNLGCSIIGSIQGETMDELKECYEYMSNNPYVDKIAITFDSKAYDNYFEHIDDKLTRWCLGRQGFINWLVRDEVWNNNKPHHLLGCSYAREFLNTMYKKISITSVDTSSPIVCGIKGVKYDEYFGNLEKPSVKLCDLLDAELDEQQRKDIDRNINIFDKILKA